VDGRVEPAVDDMISAVDSARSRQATVVLAVFAAVAVPGFALDPTLEISQYGHTAWTIRDGFFKGSVYAIAQSADGYLMLGTEFGLTRFDGIRTAAWTPPPGQTLPSNNVRTLLVARDGTLWIGTIEGLATWKNGKLTQYTELAGQHAFTLIEDREGTVWAGTFGVPTAKLCSIRGGTVRCYGEDGTFGQWVECLYEDSAGSLWAGTATGLWRWKPGPPKRYSPPYLIESDQSILEDTDRRGLIVLCRGVWRMADGKTEPYRLPGVRWPFTPLNILRDRNGGLWIGTLERGLLHTYRGRTDVFSQRDGLSGNHVRSLFEDREGNIWVATADGLDRFRSAAATPLSVRQGLSSPSTMTALAARDGSVWISTEDGLNRWKDGEISIYRASAPSQPARLPDSDDMLRSVREIVDRGLPDNQVGSLFEDDAGRIWVSAFHGISRFENGRFFRLRAPPGGWVNGIAADGGRGVWIAYQDLGLYHLVRDRVVESFPWARLQHGLASAMMADRRNGLWLGFFQGGVAYFEGGEVRASYGKKEGLGNGRVMGLQLDTDGVLWAATEGGLSRIKDGRVLTLTAANGLPCDGVHWTVEDDSHFFWLYTPCGLIRAAREELELWVSHPDRTVATNVFDASDGVRMKALLTGYTPRVSQAPDGRIWFAHLNSISAIDPRHLPFNNLAPAVHVEELIADHNVYGQNSRGGSANLRLPPLARDLEFDYTALCLLAPEKVRFKYRLEGYDGGWQAAGNRRQAFYASLPPRRYRFRVIASNNSGVWNDTGDTFEFAIAPAYYQTTLFRVACAAGLLVLFWGLYRLRMLQIAREIHANLEGRVDERLRVARDLHDTLLQSFQGLMLLFQAARNLLPERTDDAIQTLDEAIREGTEAIAEGRDAIQGLRGEPSLECNLEYLLTAAAKELARSSDTGGERPHFRIIVEGARQPLSPLLQDDVYRIAREILRNAFQHAHASRIEAEIAYDSQFFRLRIRDNGKGIDRKILEQGARQGHWGLPGIRERAKRLGAELKLWSEFGAGTEAELAVPARIAYGAVHRREGLRLFRRGKVEL